MQRECGSPRELRLLIYFLENSKDSSRDGILTTISAYSTSKGLETHMMKPSRVSTQLDSFGNYGKGLLY